MKEEELELEAIINETLQDSEQADNSPLGAFSLWVVFPLFLLILGRIVGLIQSINSIIQYILWNANITPFIITIILQVASIASAVLLLLKKKSGYCGNIPARHHTRLHDRAVDKDHHRSHPRHTAYNRNTANQKKRGQRVGPAAVTLPITRPASHNSRS